MLWNLDTYSCWVFSKHNCSCSSNNACVIPLPEMFYSNDVVTCRTETERLLVECRKLDHSIVVETVRQWRRRLSACDTAHGGRLEHIMWRFYCSMWELLHLWFYLLTVLFVAKMLLVWNALPGMGITQVRWKTPILGGTCAVLRDPYVVRVKYNQIFGFRIPVFPIHCVTFRDLSF